MAESDLKVCPLHLKDLYASGITAETILKEGLYCLEKAEFQKKLDREDFKGGGLVIPYRQLPGLPEYFSVKPDNPPIDKNGKVNKYLRKKGSGNRLFIPQSLDAKILDDPNVTLVFCEGEKKAIKANQEGIPAIAISGVNNFKDKDGILTDFNHIKFKQRLVYLVPDNDVHTNPRIREAMQAFADEVLRPRGTKVEMILFPKSPFDEKIGLDDYLLNHSVESFWSLPTDPLLKFIHVSQLPKDLKVEYAADGFLLENSRNLFGGAPEGGKTMTALDLAISFSTGNLFLGHFRVNRKRGVLIVDQESGPPRLGLRLGNLCKGNGVALEDLKIWVSSMNSIYLDKMAWVNNVRHAAEVFGAEALIIDSLVRVHKGDPNEERKMADFFERVERLRDFLPLVVIIAHIRKPPPGGIRDDSVFAFRGSGDIGAWADSAFLFEKVRKAFRVDCVKARDGIRPDPFEFELNTENGFRLDYKGGVQDVLTKLEENMAKVRSIVNDGHEWKRETLKQTSKLGDKDLNRALTALIDSDEIERIRRGIYKRKVEKEDNLGQAKFDDF